MLLLVSLAFLFTAPLVRADVLTVTLSPLSTVAAGSTNNSFDVLLTNTSGPAVSIEGFFFEIQASSTDLTLTDATTATTSAAYIFDSNSLFGPDIISAGSTAQDLDASDLDSVSAISLASGTTLALGHVLFDVAPGAHTETVDFTVVGFPGTSLADNAGNNVPITTFQGEELKIQGAATVVPEPSSLFLLAAVAPLLWSRRRGICVSSRSRPM